MLSKIEHNIISNQFISKRQHFVKSGRKCTFYFAQKAVISDDKEPTSLVVKSKVSWHKETTYIDVNCMKIRREKPSVKILRLPKTIQF